MLSESRIRDLIGPGGKNIKGIVEKTGAKVDVSDNGVVLISSRDHKAVEEALELVKGLTQEIEIGGPVFASKDAREGPRAFAEKRINGDKITSFYLNYSKILF